MTEFLAAVAQVSVLVFLVSSMSEIGLGLRLPQIVAPLRNARLSFPAALIVSTQNFTDPNVSVMVIVTTLTALIVLLPAAGLMRKQVSDRGEAARPGR